MILDFQAWWGRLPPCGTVNMMENTVNHPRNGSVLVLACRSEAQRRRILEKVKNNLLPFHGGVDV
jgi:hypothetical protein